MTSGWGPGGAASGDAVERTGEFRVRAQGPAGERLLRNGSAMRLIRVLSGLLMVLCVVVVWVTLTADGVLVLATVFAAIFLWSSGVFSASVWRD